MIKNKRKNHFLRALVVSGVLTLSFVAFTKEPHNQLNNQLKNHPSAYLTMHGDDPVAWQEWGPEVFTRALKENKLVFVSVGYFSCHWCHVMQRESYKDPKIAKFLNEHFIAVKIDRELHPALDRRLIEFVQATQGYSGWPLNVFITPEGYPIVGLVYLPPKEFSSLLTSIDTKWKTDHLDLKKKAEAAAKAMEKAGPSAGPKLAPELGAQLVEAYQKAVEKIADDLQGGFGQKNKFPNVPQMLGLLDALRVKPNKNLETFTLLTLDQMASQGLFDLIRGGFFRYTVDAQWQIPHFEKMLYDNAQLAELYLIAAKQFNKPEYIDVARRTLDFMLAEMQDTSGAFIASLSALDDKNVEGGYYLWREDELKKLLSVDELRAVKKAWGMERAPSLDAGHLPLLKLTPNATAIALQMKPNDASGLIHSAKTKLLNAQKSRKLPRDGKLLGGWNGLALRAFSLAGAGEGGERYRTEAKRIRDFLVNELWDGKDLSRAKAGGKRLGRAVLEDYAYVTTGLLTYTSLLGNDSDIVLVNSMLQRAWQRFHTAKGWVIADDLLIKFGAEEATHSDAALASPAATLMRATLAVALKRKDEKLKTQVLSALNVENKTLLEDPYWFATHIRTIIAFQKHLPLP